MQTMQDLRSYRITVNGKKFKQTGEGSMFFNRYLNTTYLFSSRRLKEHNLIRITGYGVLSF